MIIKALKPILLIGILSTLNLQASSNITIDEIVVNGNRKINTQAILAKLCFAKGDSLEKCKKTANASLKNIASMRYFVDGKTSLSMQPGKDSTHKKIVISVEEKQLLAGYEFEGNSHIIAKKLLPSLNIDNFVAIDEDDVTRMCREIERQYKKENFLSAKATAKIEPEGTESIKVVFQIEEGSKTKVLKINFVGCKKIPEHKLRNALKTKEDWLLAGLNNAGKFDKDLVEHDKRVIEEIYKNHGFLQASVSEVQIKKASNDKDLELTFCIEEGREFIVNKIGIPYDDEFNPLKIEYAILLKEGEPYSVAAVRETEQRLESVFGEEGYVFVNLYPEIIPDNATNTVTVNFKVDKGERCQINEIEITGNKVTRDYVIRREILVQEGQLANKTLMELSRQRVEYLDYFDHNSVEWKIHKIDDGKVNLELVVKEKQSGKAGLSLNYTPGAGGKTAAALICDVSKRNVLGSGVDVGCGIQGDVSSIKNAFIDIENPYLFDKNLNFGTRAYMNKTDFEGLDPIEDSVGIASSLGFTSSLLGKRFRASGEFGLESVGYTMPPLDAANQSLLKSSGISAAKSFLTYKKDWFTGGNFVRTGIKLEFDQLNYSVNPTKGWKAQWTNTLALSSASVSKEDADRVTGHSMFKTELDARFYWPLIGHNKLVFSARSRLGFAIPLGKSSKTPIIQKELFHVGGLHTVRGFKWGEAGPSFKLGEFNTPIGSKSMFVTNFELTAPVGNSSQAPHAFVFYDFGAGWSAQTLNLQQAELNFIDNNKFALRHSVGFGIKLTAPTPIRIDYGYKLNRKGGESVAELHLTMNVPF